MPSELLFMIGTVNCSAAPGTNYTKSTRYDAGHCDNSSYRTKVFKKCGWKCHECQSEVSAGLDTCACTHRACYMCSIKELKRIVSCIFPCWSSNTDGTKKNYYAGSLDW